MKFVFYADPQENTPWDNAWHYGGGDSWRLNVVHDVNTFSKPDFVWIGGDLTLNGGGYKIEDHFLNDTDYAGNAIWTTTPLFPVWGNHDWMTTQILDHDDCSGANHWAALLPRRYDFVPPGSVIYNNIGTPLQHSYTDVGHPSAFSQGRYYSFDWGNSHFITLSTGPDEDNMPLGTVGIDVTQFNWLVSD